ncbi:M3 family metallopeptidase [Amnibacterium sp. CER49]|uniref:M3 family metallopeptidase n=1 Tax=Amnibacterium sp. CER49 TaxID=3039161 RepID=UPI002447FB15|nr:M3 family metallopeptidase [Amnibacterium sp. CER49]MDH2442514.1 M3 family metallopeptidase [Amnibacterium sp. CER49]
MLVGVTDNPFLEPSTLPAGLPPFTTIRPEHYEPAFTRGMADQLVAVARIVAVDEPASFANTLEPLETSGDVLRRVSAVFFTLASADATPFIRELEALIAPRLAAHADALRLNGRLYARIEAVWAGREALDPEQRYLAERIRTEFVLAGAGLEASAKDELRTLNERLSELTTRFDANLVADTNDLALHLTEEAELAGLGADLVSAAAAAARERGLDGWLLTLVLPTMQPALASLERADVRERLLAASLARGGRDGEHDNRPVLLEIVRLRARRARLLGFPDHAAVVTADETARTPAAVTAMLERLVPPAVRNARDEVGALQRRATDAGLPGDPTAADQAYLAERERRARFDVDTDALRPYLEAERVLRDGVFRAAHELYGLTLTERDDLAGYLPEVRVFEVRDEERVLGLYLLDLYTRPTKRGGAWMNSLVDRVGLLGQDQAVVINNLNVPKPPPGEPTLLTLDTTETLFHEFGHALHGLFATVTFPTLAGTNVPRDFVEFPSQVNEMWALWPEVLAGYARHIDTGEPMPAELADRIREARRFGEGAATTEYLAAAALDQAWHRLDVEAAEAVTDVAAFERDALAAAGLDLPEVPPRYSSTYFAHVFSGGYSAAYYAYIWSEVLDADTVRWFEEHGGLRRENGDRFRSVVLAAGGSRDPLEAFREFRGRDAAIEPLLERRGLA